MAAEVSSPGGVRGWGVPVSRASCDARGGGDVLYRVSAAAAASGPGVGGGMGKPDLGGEPSN